MTFVILINLNVLESEKNFLGTLYIALNITELKAMEQEFLST
jgi:hypothetical protein